MERPLSTLAERLALVESRVAAACQRAGRPRESVTVLAVSKRHPPEAIREAYDLGLRHFGENYAQELRDKAAVLAPLHGIRWHAIGGLQTNKAKYVASAAHFFHALDRPEVAKELSKRRTGAPLQCFLEVNLGEESAKAGVSTEALPGLINETQALPGLQLVGLMALPPLANAPEDNRLHFRRLAALGKQHGLPELSMGTTADFEVAIEEGATWVRVGTALFGERPG